MICERHCPVTVLCGLQSAPAAWRRPWVTTYLGAALPCRPATTLTAKPTGVPWIAFANLRSFVQPEPNPPATGGTPASDAPGVVRPGLGSAPVTGGRGSRFTS